MNSGNTSNDAYVEEMFQHFGADMPFHYLEGVRLNYAEHRLLDDEVNGSPIRTKADRVLAARQKMAIENKWARGPRTWARKHARRLCDGHYLVSLRDGGALVFTRNDSLLKTQQRASQGMQRGYTETITELLAIRKELNPGDGQIGLNQRINQDIFDLETAIEKLNSAYDNHKKREDS